MDFDYLSDELKEKARACKTPEEILELAKAEGIEIDDAQLEAISGGDIWDGKCDAYKAECRIVCSETSKSISRRTKMM